MRTPYSDPAISVRVTVSSSERKTRGEGVKPEHHVVSEDTGETVAFQNPWDSFNHPTMLFDILQDLPNSPMPSPSAMPKVVRPTWGYPSSGAEVPTWPILSSLRRDIKATWLGHAAFMVEFPALGGATRGPRILFDPMFTRRASPLGEWVPGPPARFAEPPITADRLPTVDAVILSHNHYDHTSRPDLWSIYDKQPRGSFHFFSTLGTAKWFRRRIGAAPDHVTELDWWESRQLTLVLPSNAGPHAAAASRTLNIICTPAQHYSGRGVKDHNKSVWASFVIEDPASASKVWFAGDTGYKSVPRGMAEGDEASLPTCPAFRDIGDRYGPFDISMIPIGSYAPRWRQSAVHTSPEEWQQDAVQLHLETRSRKSIGMHFATWARRTHEPVDEPPRRLRAACRAAGLAEDEFVTLDIGETVRVTPLGGQGTAGQFADPLKRERHDRFRPVSRWKG